MDQKIGLKKIENMTKCQVTFSKRRCSLINKVMKLSTRCDVDVALVAFSPSGRVNKYCNKTRIEDVLNRYVDLPADKRLTQMENVEDKVEKLKRLIHIKGDTSKLHFRDQQVENLQLQINKCCLELQILEADLRDYETPEQEHVSLNQLSWCERNLNESLAKVMARKKALALGKMPMLHQQPIQMETQNQGRMLFSANHTENEVAAMGPNPPTGDILMKFVPLTNSYSAQVRDCFQYLLGQANIATPNMPEPSNIYNFPLLESSSVFKSTTAKSFNPQFPLKATYTDAVQIATHFQAPRNGSSSGVAANVNRSGMPQFNNFTTEEIIGQSATNFTSNLSGTNGGNTIVDIDGSFGINCTQVQRNDQVQAPPYQPQEANNTIYPDTQFGNFPPQDARGQNMSVQSSLQSSNSSWNWEDLLNENHGVVDYPPEK